MNINGKKIVITGAASGIGLEVVKQLLQFECQIVAADLNITGLAPLTDTRLIPYQVDLSTQTANDELFDFAVKEMGGIDIYFANAGFAYYEKLGEANWKHIENIFRVNVFTPLYVTKKMRDLNHDRDYKVIVTASAMSHIALPGYALYSATKAAIHRFGEAYQYEIPDHGQLMIVYPIATRTNFFTQANTDTPVPFPSQTAHAVAKSVVKGIQKDANAVYPSKLFLFYFHVSRILPFIIPLMQAYENWRFQKWQKMQS